MKFKNSLLLLLVISSIVAVAGCSSDNNGDGVQQATPQQQPTPVKGNINNPAGINETLTISSGGEVYNFSVVQVIRGNEINNKVRSANDHEKPAPGFEYLLVDVKLAYNHLFHEAPAYVYNGEFNAYCDNVECNLASVYVANDMTVFDDGNLMPGGVKEGWIAYTVPQGKEVVIGFQPGASTGSNCFVSVGSK
ncbi:hypothetical protein MSLAZ_1706 [Methanosarcina lacustris Z-7289]|uniref:DUF4352 domain-containing protein n=1 Tax=Methanosarcina lacustris Z-7289 TaxID=1434111 RepID=A0A0E3S6N6_9EURY|nr:hypothetical protein [Methanosarcina lacustris]AKB74967.1 hypothetical protein MSLAZ_1706 [Methanosarcina lacustris Z-7289]